MTQLSAANSTNSDMEFVIWGRSSIYIMNNRDTRIDPWGTPCFNVLKAEKNFKRKFEEKNTEIMQHV